MTEDLLTIRRYLRGLVLRERALIGLEVAGRALLVIAASLAILVVAPLLPWTRGAGAASLALVLGVGAWAAFFAPMLLRWPSASDRLRQARLAERVAPDLRGRLVALVELEIRGGAGESEAIVGLAAKRAAAALPVGRESRIHAGWRELVQLSAAGIALVAVLPLLLVAGGPGAVGRWWAAGLDASLVAAIELDGADEHVQVGDLVVRYVYPEYTGLAPRVVENGTGDVEAPPGTVVELTARSAELIEAAGLVAYEQRFDAQVADGRQVSGSFAVGAERGAYHLETWRGEVVRRSRDFAIEPLVDLPPEVMIDGPGEQVELAADEPLEFQWRARDDYGVRAVKMRIDGRDVGVLFDRTERRAEVFGEHLVSPQQLGLVAGQEVVFDLAASDDDTISGSKVGVSRPIRLVILGPKGLAKRSERWLEELTGLLLTALADHLEEAHPVSPVSGELARWGERVSERYRPLQDLVDRDWEKLTPGSPEAVALGDAVSTGSAPVLYTQVSFEPRSPNPASVDALADVARLRDAAIVALEDGLLGLDRARRIEALTQAVEVAERMEQISKELERMMASGAEPLQMLARLEQLEAMLSELLQEAAKLEESGLREFLNARGNELRDLMQEIRDALERGDVDEARELMERLAEQLRQLSEGVRDNLERQQQEDSDAMAEAEALTEELQRLEDEQRALQQQVSALRDQHDAEAGERDDAAWEKIQKEVAELLGELEEYSEELLDAGRPFNELQRTEAAKLSAERLRDAASGRDFRASRGALQATEIGVEAMHRGNLGTRLGRRDVEGPGDPELRVLDARLRTIRRLLEELENQSASGPAQQQVQQLQQRQQELGEQLQQARERAEQVAQEFPTRPKEMMERIDEAGERMQDASEDLGQGRPMPAEGSQGAAADRIREARESLEQAMDQARQQGQRGGPGEERGQGQQDRGGNNPNSPPPPLDLGREEFRSPEEYRRALLEGMEGEVPEEFQALKKRYFEELVRQ